VRLLGLLLLRWKAGAAGLFAGLVIFAIGAGYFHDVVGDRATWTRAERERLLVLSTLRAALGRPRPGTTIIASGFPLWIGPTIPVFATYLDLDTAAQVMWNDPSIVALPAGPASISCQSTGIAVAGIGPAAQAAYGRTYFVNVPTKRAIRVSGVAACRSMAASIG
jgi:hypothetical protein